MNNYYLFCLIIAYARECGYEVVKRKIDYKKETEYVNVQDDFIDYHKNRMNLLEEIRI